jgi:hypothetical protein
MKHLSSILSLFVTLLILNACSNIKYTADFDKEVNFNQYKTFAFLGWQEDSGNTLTDFDQKRLRDSFVEEFSKRNITLVNSGGDMAVMLYVVTTKETSVTSYTNYYGGGGRGRYRRGRRGGWGGGYASTSYSESDYLKGTLVLDIFDNSDGSQIWQGVAQGTISEKPEKREKSVPSKVKALMGKYPVKPVK